MKRVFMFVFVIAILAIIVVQFSMQDIPMQKVIGGTPIKQNRGLTISAEQEVDSDQIRVFDGSGDLVCGIDNEGHAFIGQGHTWKECSVELMRDFGYKVQK